MRRRPKKPGSAGNDREEPTSDGLEQYENAAPNDELYDAIDELHEHVIDVDDRFTGECPDVAKALALAKKQIVAAKAARVDELVEKQDGVEA